jgi:hypothetical protein
MRISHLSKSIGLSCRALVFVFIILVTAHTSAQTTRIWNGSLNNDWFNPTNWIPIGVPAANDSITVSNGTVNLDAPVTIAGQFNWTGGILSGNPLTIASNGVMNMNGSSTLYLENPLTNFGTITWTNNGFAGDLDVMNNNGAPYAGLIENMPGGLFEIQCDLSLYNNASTPAGYFRNLGTLRKSAKTGATSFNFPLINSGSVTGLQGNLVFGVGGILAGTFAAATNATISFSGGNFTNSTPVSISGPGLIQFAGGNLWLLADAIPNLQLTAGTVNLGQNFQQNGAITNLTVAGSTLAGSNTVTGTFNWNNGIIAGGPLTVANNGVMNINGSTILYLENPLTNFGTVTWTNSGFGGDLDVLNNNGAPYTGLIENHGLFDIQCDLSLYNNASATAGYFHNLGTLRKSAKTGATSFNLAILNSGSVTGPQGNLVFGGGGILAGTFTAATNASISFSGGNFTNSGPVSLNGPGLIQLGGGNLWLLTDVIPNLLLSGGTVNLGLAFQGGTITNLTISGATLAGTNVVTGTFNWNNGFIAGGPLTIASNALMHINGSTTMYLENPLTNFGTIIWTNTGFGGDLDVLNNSGAPYTGLIENMAGALFDIQCDLQIYNNSSTTAVYFRNLGTLCKSAKTGGTAFNLPIINSGSVTALQGNLVFGLGGILAGTFTAATNATISFSGGSFTNSAPVSMLGPGLLQLAGGNLWLLSDAIPNLQLAGGTANLGQNFQQNGAITNLTISGATLAGTNIVTGTFNWNNGIIAGGPLTIASNGVMKMNGVATMYLENPLTNFGTITWTNIGFTGDLDVMNNNGAPYAGLIENRGFFDIQCDQSLYNNSSGTAWFYNLGTLQKSARSATTGISIPVTNAGTISSLKGNIAFAAGFTPMGGALLFGLSGASSYGTMSIPGNATSGGTVGVLWLNGFVPASGNSFTLLNYGSYNGIFTNVIVPPSAAVWVTNYGPTSFTMSVASINKLAFTTQPVGGVLTNIVIPPVLVQIQDPSNNPVAVSGVPISLSLASGSGIINGTLTKSTDANGRSTFNDLSFSAVGAKTLRATSSGLTTATSLPFEIAPLIGLKWTNTGFLIQLSGANGLAPITIYASTNLTSWIPIYTNVPTNGPILFLDAAATNYRARFYHIFEQ